MAEHSSCPDYRRRFGEGVNNRFRPLPGGTGRLPTYPAMSRWLPAATWMPMKLRRNREAACPGAGVSRAICPGLAASARD